MSLKLFSAQKEGGLSNLSGPDTNQLQPLYAHCKMHEDKLLAKLVYLSLKYKHFFNQLNYY